MAQGLGGSAVEVRWSTSERCELSAAVRERSSQPKHQQSFAFVRLCVCLLRITLTKGEDLRVCIHVMLCPINGMRSWTRGVVSTRGMLDVRCSRPLVGLKGGWGLCSRPEGPESVEVPVFHVVVVVPVAVCAVFAQSASWGVVRLVLQRSVWAPRGRLEVAAWGAARGAEAQAEAPIVRNGLSR